MSTDNDMRIRCMQRIGTTVGGRLSSDRIRWRAWAIVLGALCTLVAPGSSYAADVVPSLTLPGLGGSSPLQVCPRPNHRPPDTDTYALCAVAQCFYLNGVAYCKCEVLKGDSISVSYDFRADGKKQDICDLLDEGVDNGFTVSTYSTPEQLTQEYAAKYRGHGPAPLALYTCPGGSTGSYAQCDGGICFDSTTGSDFPGVGPVGDKEIICSCPITSPRMTLPNQQARLGYQISGPWQKRDGSGACGANGDPADCCSRKWFNRFCSPNQDPTTGTIIPVGAPTGSALVLSRLLDGTVPKVNSCDFSRNSR